MSLKPVSLSALSVQVSVTCRLATVIERVVGIWGGKFLESQVNDGMDVTSAIARTSICDADRRVSA